MKSIVEIEIDAPREQVARLFSDPANNRKWMDDIISCEAIRGEPGETGSSYRMVPKRGDPFVATVVARELPSRLRLRLDSPDVEVQVTDVFAAWPGNRTKLVSVEEFHFRGGVLSRLKGAVAARAIRKAHRKHIRAFKTFAES